MKLQILENYIEVKPVAITDKVGLEHTCESYEDALKCLNLLSEAQQTRHLTPAEIAYQEACIYYMYDIIDTLLNRLLHADTERFTN